MHMARPLKTYVASIIPKVELSCHRNLICFNVLYFPCVFESLSLRKQVWASSRKRCIPTAVQAHGNTQLRG